MIVLVRGGYGLYVRSGEYGEVNGVIEIVFCFWCGFLLFLIGEIDLFMLLDDVGD